MTVNIDNDAALLTVSIPRSEITGERFRARGEGWQAEFQFYEIPENDVNLKVNFMPKHRKQHYLVMIPLVYGMGNIMVSHKFYRHERNAARRKAAGGVSIKRTAALILAFVMALGCLSPLFSGGRAMATGSEWTASMKRFEGYGGVKYYKGSNYNVKIYENSSGDFHYYAETGGSERRMYILENVNTGEKKAGYCIGAGLKYTSGSSYGADVSFGEYFNTYLSENARNGIKYATIYGYQEGKSCPVAGANIYDYWMATQTVIWEYQQGLREDGTERHDNGLVLADTFYNTIKGKPAEKCYDYILECISEHTGMPSFVSDTQEDAPSKVWTLSETSAGSGVYKAEIYNAVPDSDRDYVVRDTSGNILPGVSVTRSGSKYTVTSTVRTEAPVTVMLTERNAPADDDILFYVSGSTQQPLISCGGFADPLKFYMQLKTVDKLPETFTLKITKKEENGNVSGVPFIIYWHSYYSGFYTEASHMTATDNLGYASFTVNAGYGFESLAIPVLYIIEPDAEDYNILAESFSGISAVTPAYFYKLSEGGEWSFGYNISQAESLSSDGSALKGFVLSLDSSVVRAGGLAEITIRNTPKKADIRVKKTSSTGEKEGFRFEIEGLDSSNRHISGLSGTTDASGTADFTGLPLGRYKVSEILPIGTQWEQPRDQYVTLDEDGITVMVTFENSLRKSSVRIVKYSEDGIFDGVSFNIKSESGTYDETYEANEENVYSGPSGNYLEILVENLVPGRYTVTEICPERYEEQVPCIIILLPDTTKELVFENRLKPITGSLTVAKEISNRETVFSHGDPVFVFEIHGVLKSGEEVTLYRVFHFESWAVDTEHDGISGKLFTLDGLEPGTYTVKELKTLRYSIRSVSVSRGDADVNADNTVTFEIKAGNTDIYMRFVNEVTDQEHTSHTALCINHITV